MRLRVLACIILSFLLPVSQLASPVAQTQVKPGQGKGEQEQKQKPGPQRVKPLKRVVPGAIGPLPDLVVRRIWLDDSCRLNVEVANVGRSGIHPQSLKRSKLRLWSGKRKIEPSLQRVDAKRSLTKSQGVASFRTGIRLKQPVTVAAMIDSNKTIAEANEANNTIELAIAEPCLTLAERRAAEKRAAREPKSPVAPEKQVRPIPSPGAEIQVRTRTLTPQLTRKQEDFRKRQAAASARLRAKVAGAAALSRPRSDPLITLERYLAHEPAPVAGTERSRAATRITTSSPAPVAPGRELRIRGERFGGSGRVMLDFEGLLLQLPVEGWADREITVRIPEELREFVGGTRHDSRLWVHAEAGIATKTVLLGPDRPVIYRVDPATIEAGVDITIEGDRFLTEQAGTVDLLCHGYDASRGTILEWSQTVVGVLFFPAFGRALNEERCEVVLRNHLDHEARKSVSLTIRLEREELTYHIRPRSFYEERLRDVRLPVGRELINGWFVRSSDLSWSNDGSSRFSRAVIQPTSNGRAEITLICTGGGATQQYCRPDEMPSEILYELVIEGPLGFPYYAAP